jgi:hypothetical protein
VAGSSVGVVDGVAVFSGVGVSVGRGEGVAEGGRVGVNVGVGLGEGVAVSSLVAVGGSIVGVGGDDAEPQAPVNPTRTIRNALVNDDKFIRYLTIKKLEKIVFRAKPTKDEAGMIESCCQIYN